VCSSDLVRSAAEKAEWAHAQEEMQKLMLFLKRRAPRTERGKAIYGEANLLLQQVLKRQIPGPEAGQGKAG
jgi:hypothetical protein